jgi:uncharacterized protein YaaR (DUF327 family)
MSTIDSLNSSLYFNAAAVASKNIQKKEEDTKTQKSQKTKSFDKMLDSATQNLEFDDFIPEIKGMTIEQAKEFLIDSVYSEGDLLKQKPTEENIIRFRKAVSNFLKFVEKQCYDVEGDVGIRKMVRKGNVKVPIQNSYTLLKLVDEKLDGLAADILSNHREQIQIAAKVNEIYGLLVNILM